MTLIDDRGRIFGKVNAIDALVVLVVVVLIPIAYGAYALFRTPIPAIVAVEPASLVRAASMAVTIRGQNLRPYLRAQIGTTPPAMVPFSIESPSVGHITLPDLAPGSYELVLFDEAREVARRPGAIVIVASPETAEVQVKFVASPEILDAVKAGDADLSGGATAPERAVLTAVGADRQPVNVMVSTETIHHRSFTVPQAMLTFTGTLRVPVAMGAMGWQYRDRPIKVGAAFTFESVNGVMTGWIMEAKVPEPK
jgi:hypothetical protein